ncbi:MAG TPA: hypothetical protein ENJ32_04125 [Crenotrichaceae bacterium]|nr:hypothetical protein [Crenotrichaceae bacterium]
MGLEAVELIMAIEEEFDISIPDEESAKLDTVGKLYQYILDILYVKQSESSIQVDEEDVWERTQDVIVTQLGVSPEQVTEDASFVSDLGID